MKKIYLLLIGLVSALSADDSFPDLGSSNPDCVVPIFGVNSAGIDRARLSKTIQGEWHTVVFGHDVLPEGAALSLSVDAGLNYVLKATDFDLELPGYVRALPQKGTFKIIPDGDGGEVFVMTGLAQNPDIIIPVSLTKTDLVIWIGDPPWVLQKSPPKVEPER
jgi:hypothetical protein